LALFKKNTFSFDALKWFGTATGVIGALILALNLPVSGWGWVLFAFSSFSWTIAGAVMKDYSLMVLQLAFLIVGLIGIWRWLIIENKVLTLI
tara:strand:- start:286 stop:561 length:276 start_codon:yes stop_codon:yes gene_type:complete